VGGWKRQPEGARSKKRPRREKRREGRGKMETKREIGGGAKGGVLEGRSASGRRKPEVQILGALCS